MTLDPAIEQTMLRSIPDLLGYARSLCRNRDRADDLLQETLTRAIAGINTFRRGTNLEAWLFTILRNTFSNEHRRSKWIEHDVDGRRAGLLTVLPDQDGWCIAKDLRAGLGKLPNPYRQAIILVGVSGLGYDEAAAIAGCQVGTMKSRVSRARKMLAAMVSGDTAVHDKPISDVLSAQPSALVRRRREPRALGHSVATESSRPARDSRWRTERTFIHAARSRVGERRATANASAEDRQFGAAVG